MTLNARFNLKCALRTARTCTFVAGFGFDRTHRCNQRGEGGLEGLAPSMWAADALFLCGSGASCYMLLLYKASTVHIIKMLRLYSCYWAAVLLKMYPTKPWVKTLKHYCGRLILTARSEIVSNRQSHDVYITASISVVEDLVLSQTMITNAQLLAWNWSSN